MSLKERLRPYYLRGVYFPLLGGRPQYFRDAWQYPHQPLTPEAIKEIAAAPRRAFLFLPMSDWHARLQRPHHLARSLARQGHRCYLLNIHLGRQVPSLYAADPHPRIATLEPDVYELHIRLPLEPVYHHRLLSAAESAQLAESLAIVAAAEPHLVQVVSFPTWGAAAVALRERHGCPLIYDCHDLLEGFGNVPQEVVAAEPRVMAQADHTLFSSVYLEEQFRPALPPGQPHSMLRNAVVDGWAAQVPPRAQRNQRPVVGYFGALQGWFDAAAVHSAAQQMPEADFRLIGRAEGAALQELSNLPNVRLMGEVAHADLPADLAEFDVGLIPFHVQPLTLATNPIKLYEYFAAGIPVVSAPLPEVALFGNLVYLTGPGEWPQQVRAALQERDPQRAAQRRALAASETWSSRARALAAIAGALV